MSQECFSLSVFSFLPVDSLHSSRAAAVAILPSALWIERFRSGMVGVPNSVGAAIGLSTLAPLFDGSWARS